MKLQRKFFGKRTEQVAKDLLGKLLYRRVGNKVLKARIVETEAYYGRRDPASRASKQRGKNKIGDIMFEHPGTILVYMVHNNWLINIVTEKKGKAGAVLLRAVEPLNFDGNTRGPGRLTKALKIDREFNGRKIISNDLWIEKSNEKFKLTSSNRVGVSHDFKKKLRFFVKGNRFVSR